MQDGLRADTRKDTTNNIAMLSGDASQKFEVRQHTTDCKNVANGLYGPAATTVYEKRYE